MCPYYCGDDGDCLSWLLLSLLWTVCDESARRHGAIHARLLWLEAVLVAGVLWMLQRLPALLRAPPWCRSCDWPLAVASAVSL